jgi:hypothetical protein
MDSADGMSSRCYGSWGKEVAALHSGCGVAWLLLLTTANNARFAEPGELAASASPGLASFLALASSFSGPSALHASSEGQDIGVACREPGRPG